MSFLHAKCEKNISDLNKEISDLKNEHAKLNKQNKDLSKNITKYNAKITKLEKSNDDNTSLNNNVLNRLMSEISPTDTKLIEIISTIKTVDLKNFKLPTIKCRFLIEDTTLDISQIIADLPQELNNNLNNVLINPTVVEVKKESLLEIAQRDPQSFLNPAQRSRYSRNDVYYFNYYFESKYKGRFEDCCSAITNLCLSMFQSTGEEELLKQATQQVYVGRYGRQNRQDIFTWKVSVLKSIRDDNYHEIEITRVKV